MTAPALGPLLDYLAEVGYGELYLGPVASGPAGLDPGDQNEARPVAGRHTPAGEPAPHAQSAATQSAATATARAAALAALESETQGCERCRLCEKRNKVVFGTGEVKADLMFIGEAPGEQEDRQGLPFVGPAGALLNKIIGAIGLTREEVYIANTVKCRPPGNRNPRPDEVVACHGFLEKQIELVAPKVIVALGKVAAQTLLGNDFALGRMRNQWYQLHGVDLIVTYHPAALLRNSRYKRPTWEDMQKVRDRLQGKG